MFLRPESELYFTLPFLNRLQQKEKKVQRFIFRITEEERDDPLFCLLWVLLGSEGRWILSSIDDLNTRWLLQIQTQDLFTAKIARTLRVFFLFVLC